MANRFINIQSINYESESDVITLDFEACRMGNSVSLSGFSETINIPIDTNKIKQSFTFSIILDASTASISDSTTFKPSIVEIDFKNDFKKDDNINFKLLGQKLIGNSGLTFSELNQGLDYIVSNINFPTNLSGFSASVKDSKIVFTAPERTGVYYNGFTIQTILNGEMIIATFSGGETIYSLSMGNSFYNLVV